MITGSQLDAFVTPPSARHVVICGRVFELVERGEVYPTLRRRERREVLIAAPRL